MRNKEEEQKEKCLDFSCKFILKVANSRKGVVVELL